MSSWIGALFICFIIFINSCMGRQFDMADKIRQINEESDIIQNMLKQYDKHVRPPPLSNSKTPAVIVYVNCTIYHYKFDLENRLSLDMELQQTWFDSWLAYSRDSSVSYVTLDGKLDDKIWTPDTTVTGESIQESPKIYENLAKVFATGMVEMKQRLRLPLYCKNTMIGYPLFDTRNCSLIWGSAKYNAEDIVMEWNSPDPILFLRESGIFKMYNWEYDNFTSSSESYISSWFIFRRSNLYHQLLVLYLPSIVGLTISWLTLYLHPKIATAKLAILTAILLCFCAFFMLTRKPNSSSDWMYLNFWDIWMLFCIFHTLFLFLMTMLIHRSNPVQNSSSQKHKDQAPRSQAADYLWSVMDTNKEVRGLNLFTDDIDGEQRRLTLGSMTNTGSSNGCQPALNKKVTDRKEGENEESCDMLAFATKILVSLLLVGFNVGYWICLYRVRENQF